MNIGDKFPDLLGKDYQGNEVKLSNYPGMKFIIYFYPKDSTPGCTMEAVNFRDNYDVLRNMGYQVIGVSRDSAQSHCRFAEKNGLQFPLVTDSEGTLCELAGVWQEKKMAGRKYMGIVRTTFITDENGEVTDKIEKVKTKEASEQIFSLLDGRDDINPA